MTADTLLVAEFGDFGDDEFAKVAFKDGQTGRTLRVRRLGRADLRELRLAEDLASGHERAFGGVRGLERGEGLTKWLFGDNESQRALVRALAGPAGALEPNILSLSRRLELRCADPLVLAQPWQLLSWQGLRLVDQGWSVYLAPPHLDPAEGVIPALPLVLVIAPALAPDGVDGIGARRHLAELTTFLKSVGLPSKSIRTVTSLVEIEAACERASRWDIVYFFGHGHADRDGASLVLSDGFGGEEQVPLVDIEAVIRGASPSIIYLNACRAGASGWYGAGHRCCAPGRAVFSHLCPIEAAAAGERALAFFRRLLVERIDPLSAFSQGAKGSPPSGTAWMAGTVHSGARTWRVDGKPGQIRLDDDDRWALSLDRTAQRDTVMSRVHNDLFRPPLRGIAFVAHGGADSLVEHFGRQAHDFLRDDEVLHLRRLPLVRIDVTAPPQPTHTEEPWTEHLLAALGGQAGERLDEAVSAYLRSERSIHDGRALLWLNFGRPTYAPGGLKALLHRWLGVCRTWTEQLARIDTLRVAFVIGLELTPIERSRVTAELDGRELRKSFNRGPFEYKQLDELAPLRSDQDIAEFLSRSQSVELSEQAADRVAESIYRASLIPGQDNLASYRQCVDRLNRGRAGGWDQLLAELGVPPAEHDEW